MPGARWGVVPWLLAGIAFLGAALLTGRSQPFWFAIQLCGQYRDRSTFASADAAPLSRPLMFFTMLVVVTANLRGGFGFIGASQALECGYCTVCS